MGRLASIVAKELLLGQRVVIVRAEELNISASSKYPPLLSTTIYHLGMVSPSPPYPLRGARNIVLTPHSIMVEVEAG